jgi:hypothetical protein
MIDSYPLRRLRTEFHNCILVGTPAIRQEQARDGAIFVWIRSGRSPERQQVFRCSCRAEEGQHGPWWDAPGAAWPSTLEHREPSRCRGRISLNAAARNRLRAAQPERTPPLKGVPGGREADRLTKEMETAAHGTMLWAAALKR